MTDSLSLQVERVIPGPIEAVFDAWLDADSLKRWMTPGPGMTVPVATTDPRIGGRFHIVMRHDGRDIPHDGEYRVIDRPTKLVFTWISEPAGNTLVTIDFQTRAVEIARDHFDASLVLPRLLETAGA
jgi:uncharacterized protein YndB with AHSA1/START domain